MPRGAKDYSNVSGGTIVSRLDDMAELACRMGSPDTFDRAGRIVLIESFQYGYAPWLTLAIGSGSEVIISAEDYRSFGYSCKLKAGSTSSRVAQILRFYPYLYLSKHGLEFSIKVNASIESVNWKLVYRDEINYHVFLCQYIPAQKKIKCQTTESEYVDVMTDVTLYVEHGFFNTIKLVADLERDFYSRLTVNNRMVDLSYLPGYVFSSTSIPYSSCGVTVYSIPGVNGIAYVDDIIVTQDEP